MCDLMTCDINSLLIEFNQIHPKLQFNSEIESNNKINYLDLSNKATRIVYNSLYVINLPLLLLLFHITL
jgi:hypothetical protein